jgi:hypothetical protein
MRNELSIINHDRLIRGTFIKCTDGHWSDRDGAALRASMRLLALATTRALQKCLDTLNAETDRQLFP